MWSDRLICRYLHHFFGAKLGVFQIVVGKLPPCFDIPKIAPSFEKRQRFQGEKGGLSTVDRHIRAVSAHEPAEPPEPARAATLVGSLAPSGTDVLSPPGPRLRAII